MVVADMEFAKKMLLVDPITFQRQQEYKEIQKSGALQVKADLSLDMKRIMNSDMPEDERLNTMHRHWSDTETCRV